MNTEAGVTSRFGSVLSDAVQAHGLDWSHLAANLADQGHLLDQEVLRAWAEGAALPQSALERTAVPALEVLVGAPAGALSRLVPARPAGSPSLPLRPLDVDESLYADLERRLDRTRVQVTIISIDDALTLGADRQLLTHRVRELVRADADGADGRLIWFQSEGEAGTPYVLPEHNSRLGRVIDVPDRALLACDLRFGHALPEGASWSFTYCLGHVGPSEPATYWERTCHTPLGELHIEVRFHPEALPSRVESYVESAGVLDVQRAELSGDAASVLLFDVGPATAGIRWEW